MKKIFLILLALYLASPSKALLAAEGHVAFYLKSDFDPRAVIAHSIRAPFNIEANATDIAHVQLTPRSTVDRTAASIYYTHEANVQLNFKNNKTYQAEQQRLQKDCNDALTTYNRSRNIHHGLTALMGLSGALLGSVFIAFKLRLPLIRNYIPYQPLILPIALAITATSVYGWSVHGSQLQDHKEAYDTAEKAYNAFNITLQEGNYSTPLGGWTVSALFTQKKIQQVKIKLPLDIPIYGLTTEMYEKLPKT